MLEEKLTEIFALIISATFGWLGYFLGPSVAKRIGLTDLPKGRKRHEGEVPLIGGPIIVSMILIVITINQDFQTVSLKVFLGGFALFILGAIDDRYSLSWSYRLFFQTIITLGLASVLGIYVTDLGAFVFADHVHLGAFSFPFTVLAVIGLTNAFNMIDGHDGLAGISLLTAVCGILLMQPNAILSNNLLVALTFAVLIFLCFNLRSAKTKKVFLGDTGSYFIGFVISWLLIFHSQGERQSVPPEFVVWCVAIPIMDCVRVLVFRANMKRNLFKPDRSHIHHVLLSLGLNRWMVIFVFSILCLLLMVIGYYCVHYVPRAATILFVLLTLIYIWVGNALAKMNFEEYQE